MPLHQLPVLIRRVAALLGVGLAAAATVLTAQQPRQQKQPTVLSQPCQDSLPVIYERISPAVVAIGAMSINPFDTDHRLDRVTGSGIIIDTTGLILTNSHVVFGRQVLTVTLDNGATVGARLVGADPLLDVALVRIPMPEHGTLRAAPLGDSDRLRVGAEVYAIGNPLGLDQTLTRGVVSATNRLLPGSGWSLTEPLIQTDAAINPGSSGGPLVDRCGEVVGITTAILSQAQSIGFAVPIRLARAAIPELVDHGHVVRPWLGVQGEFVMPMLKQLLRVPIADGFLVEAVEPGSPAEEQGLQGGSFELAIEGHPILLGGDVITAINGVRLDSPASLDRASDGWKVGSRLHLTVVRGTDQRMVDVTLAERPFLPGDLTGHRSATPTASPGTPAERPAPAFRL